MNSLRLTLSVSALLAAALVLAPVSLSGLADVQAAYPEKPIRIIVGFKPGGRTDTVARLMAKEIKERNLLPQPLVVVNVPGAGSTIAGRQAQEAEPDGYTLIHWHHQMLIANAMGTFAPDAGCSGLMDTSAFAGCFGPRLIDTSAFAGCFGPRRIDTNTFAGCFGLKGTDSFASQKACFLMVAL